MKQSLKIKVTRLKELVAEESQLRKEIQIEACAPYVKMIGKMVKIVGHKGWNTGRLKEIRADIWGHELTLMAKVFNGKKDSGFIPVKSLEFLSEQEEKDLLLHKSISVGK